MNPGPGSLPDRLKELDEVGLEMGPPEFDLGMVICRGERRRRRRNAASAGAAVVTAGAAFALAAAFIGAIPQEQVSVAAVDVAYVQRGDSVMVAAGGDSLARVTLDSAKIEAGGHGQVEVSVESGGGFALDAQDFLWAADGHDQGPVAVASVDGAQRFRLSYDEVSAGELAWTLPGTERLAAVWQIGPAAGAVAVRRDQVWYLQRQNAVTVYQGSKPKARVTVAVGRDPGIAWVQLSARGSYELRGDDFVWASADGSQHAPMVNRWESLAVEEGEIKSATVNFGEVGKGTLIWSPDGTDAVGAWPDEH